MRHLKTYKTFEGISISDSKIPKLERTKELSEEEFLKILHENCKNFSFSNDELWRSRTFKYQLELFTPSYRNAQPLAFPNFFNKIEKDPDYPVNRKMSLIGWTNRDIVKWLVLESVYQVIPFDDSEIVFCPIVDLWAMDDDRIKKSEMVNKQPVGKEHFIKVSYEKNFKVPFDELEKISRDFKLKGTRTRKHGYEFFTSSPCLLIYESKLNWLRNNI